MFLTSSYLIFKINSNSSRGKVTPKCCCCSICYCSYLLLLVWN